MDRISARLWAPACAAALVALASCKNEPSKAALPFDPAPAITGIRVTPDSVLLAWLGATAPLRAELRNARGNVVVPPRVYWSSSDPAVAKVDSTGVVEGVGVGTARVSAAFLEFSDTVTVRVDRVPVAMTLTPDTALLTSVGQTLDLHATVRDGAQRPIADATIRWTSPSSNVAWVSDRGLVTAIADGVAMVYARADTLVRATRVRVATRPVSMSVTPAQLKLDGVSDTARVVAVARSAAGVPMFPPQPTFTSSDTTVVTVDFIGFVIARKAGTATIAVKADTLRANVPVTVTQTIAEVRIVPDTAIVGVGATRALAALVRDRYGITVPGASVAWTSSNAAVATVSATGVASGVAPGTATITATAGGRSGTALVTVR